MGRFIRACKDAAISHPHPELCLGLAMKAQERLTLRRLNDVLGASGYQISAPLLVGNGKHYD